ncbi:MAG: hypothetical protein M9962_00420 [Oligoflexia bacterium]|nr:hypothetical protein [Oligoflexia bacterium]
MIFALLLLVQTAFAGPYQIFGIKSEFPMEENKSTYRDVYISMGSNQGIKIGSQLEAFRVSTTIDEINQRAGKNFTFPVARLKVIHVENDMAVARVLEMYSADKTPLTSNQNVMVGDQIEVAKR